MFVTPASQRAVTVGDLVVTNEESETFSVPAYARGGCVGQSATTFAEHAPRTRETSIRDQEVTETVPRAALTLRSGKTGDALEREFEPKDRRMGLEAGAEPVDERREIDKLYETLN